MLGNHFTIPVVIPGTLAANVVARFCLPFDCVLAHVSAVAANDSDATLKIGDAADDDKVLVAAAIGDSATPVEKTAANWATTNPTGRYARGDVFLATLDFDGASGTAAQNVSLLFTFREG
jgi:hypothetical protein